MAGSTPRRKRVLDLIRDQLRKRGYVPILFDFERRASRDFTETVVTMRAFDKRVVNAAERKAAELAP